MRSNLASATVALIAASAGPGAAQAAPAGDAGVTELICRGTRTVFEEGSPRAFRWVEQRWRVDFADGEVRGHDGRLLDAEITPSEIAFVYEARHPSGSVMREVRIGRADGAFVERSVVGNALRDRTEGVCFRAAY